MTQVTASLASVLARPVALLRPLEAAVGPRPRNVLIVGAGGRGLALAVQMQDPSGGRHLVGFVEDDPAMAAGVKDFKVLGATDAILDVIDQYKIDEIVVAYAPSWCDQLLHRLIRAGHQDSVTVKVVPTLYDTAIGELPGEAIQDVPLLQLNGLRPTMTHNVVKRALDIVLAAVMLVLVMPFVALAAVGIRLTSPGPALFRQRRVGRGGREFTIFKLRTMVVDAEVKSGPVLARRGDVRVTRLGRLLRDTRIDELPQLWNVLRGDMSLVGPRPERPEFVALHAQRIAGYLKRLEVKPGITGLAQVYAGYLTNVYDKLRYDWMYVHKRSLLLDLKILGRTVGTVLMRRGC
ncbi:MAG TPA: sugar transferase [Polyangia bacterium]|jgi:exopolysaccharide biosynthesis polyprenyl glycosylphosphotransferase